MRTDADHRRHAVQIVSALPESVADALLVLKLAQELVETFLASPQEPDDFPVRDRGAVVSLSSASSGLKR